ncbi:MAG TPA: glycerophosphodiester phosphodiesterase family protein [Xanthobacteraceae bacterium]|nr:glycerophosphodiester phosphodiesterase family protein [Xanthobacteraceae bacterium]
MRLAPDWLIARPVAHRGLHDANAGAIENTPTAFAAAVAANYAIECDLQISADGEAMVHHDDVLGRLNEGNARLDAITSAELRRVAFKGTGDRMISLGELCDLVGGRVTLVIELKSARSGDTRLPVRAASVLSAYAGPCALMSFDPAQIAAVRAKTPGLTRGIVAERWSGDRADPGNSHALAYLRGLLAARPQFVAYSIKDLPALLPTAARHLCGMPLLTWTVRGAEDRARAARFADQMIFEGFRP